MLIANFLVREARPVDRDNQAPQAPTGTHDVMPPESARWEALLALFASLAQRYGFSMVHTPIFEDIKVFHRGIGEASEVVGKEMYEFTDRGGRHLALRPEGTASIVRAYIQHRPPLPFKAWYATPSFRYERPQAGRYRQHHQVGVEALGTDDPDLDVEVITLAKRFFDALGLKGIDLTINSMGDAACRPAYIAVLEEFLAGHAGELCEEHQKTFAINPLRVLDCKKPACRAVMVDAPLLSASLCEACREHFERVQTGLGEAGIVATRNERLVRGFDYYTRTTFEFAAEALEGAQNAVGGGGRYDGLVEAMGGPATSGIGFGIGIERVLLACDAEGVFDVVPTPPLAFVVDVTGGAEARRLVEALRGLGVGAERSYDDRSMKAQFKAADRSGARFALLVGPEELANGAVTVRDLREDTEQRTISEDELLRIVRETGTI
jgi:histidyl-tRNA synthetase